MGYLRFLVVWMVDMVISGLFFLLFLVWILDVKEILVKKCGRILFFFVCLSFLSFGRSFLLLDFFRFCMKLFVRVKNFFILVYFFLCLLGCVFFRYFWKLRVVRSCLIIFISLKIVLLGLVVFFIFWWILFRGWMRLVVIFCFMGFGIFVFVVWFFW